MNIERMPNLHSRMDSSGKAAWLSILLAALAVSFRVGLIAASMETSSFADEALVKSSIDSVASANAIPAQKATETPHFWQRDSRGGFENGGRDYCCPVAVSNSLVYLARHGFPALLSNGDGIQPQIDLINRLASSDYFGTDPQNGTPPGAVLTGVQKYVEAKGYGCERLEYEGWRQVGRNNNGAIKAGRPALDWIKEGIRSPNGAVWLNIGWYRQLDQGHWKRIGGHWVTLVGYGGTDANAVVKPLLLLIHNPATRDNMNPADNLSNDVIHLEQIGEGTLDTGTKSTEDAAGMYRVSGLGLPLPSGVDAAFLDAAIVLVVKAR